MLRVLGNSSFVDIRREFPMYTSPKSVRNKEEETLWNTSQDRVYKDDASVDLRDASCHSTKII